MRRKRPSDRPATEQRNELAPPHSITSSANREQVRRYVEAERFRGLEIDHEFELGGSQHW